MNIEINDKTPGTRRAACLYEQFSARLSNLPGNFNSNFVLILHILFSHYILPLDLRLHLLP